MNKMIKILFIFGLFINASQVFAEDCDSCDASNSSDPFQEVKASIPQTGCPTDKESCDLPHSPKCAFYNPSCFEFMGLDCKLAKHGELLRNEIEKYDFVKKPPKDIKKYCKNYDDLSKKKKEKFWVYVLMRLAFQETSCGEILRNPANHKATGMFQLENKNSTRVGIRPVECHNSYIQNKKNFVKGTTIATFDANATCAVAQLNQQFLTPDSKECIEKAICVNQLFSGNSYWEQFRKPLGTKKAYLAKAVVTFPGCFD